MIGKFAYSLNGEHYVGAFGQRDAALSAAFDVARRESTPPSTVYVGRMIAADPKAAGHARIILANMAARAREEVGAPGDGYLKRLDKPQIEDLDRSLENTILGWLTKHGLMPTFFRVESISEHPVPAAPRNVAGGTNDEVHDLGVSDAAEVSM